MRENGMLVKRKMKNTFMKNVNFIMLLVILLTNKHLNKTVRFAKIDAMMPFFNESFVGVKIASTDLIFHILLISVLTILGFQVWRMIKKEKEEKHTLLQHLEDVERILNALPMAIVILDTDMNIVNLNKVASTLFQTQIKTAKGKSYEELMDDLSQKSYETIQNYGNGSTFIKLHDVDYFVITSQMEDEEGKVLGSLKILKNISEQVDVEKDLEERTLELETISQNLIGGLLITSLDDGFTILQCNQGYLDLIGCKKEDVLGKPAVNWLLKKESSHVANSIFKQLKTENEVRIQHLLHCKDGEEIWVSLYGRQTVLHKQDVGIWLLINIDENKRIEQQMKISEERYRIAIENMDDIIIDYDIEADIAVHNEKVTEVYGIDTVLHNPQSIVLKEGLLHKDSIEAYQKIFNDMRSGKEKAVCEILTYGKSGEEIWCRLILTTIFSEEGKPIRGIGVMHDITREKLAMLDYQREANYRKLMMDDTTLYYEANLTKKKMLKGHEKLVESLLAKPSDDYDVVIELMINHLVYKDDQEKVRQMFQIDHLLYDFQTGKNKLEFEYQRILDQGNRGWVRGNVYITQDEVTKDVKIICNIKDIDESKQLEFYLKRQAEIDLLTGLYNKMTTEYLIKKSLSQMQRNQIPAFMIIDLDDFKIINDTLGHSFGDAVLSEVSQRLQDWVQKDEILGRIGGDEFVVYLKDSDKEHAKQKASDICNLFHETYTKENTNYRVSGSVGIAFAPSDATSFDELYQKADVALYAAKNSGKDKYAIYHPSMPLSREVTTYIRSIDRNAGKLFSENIREYILQILYDAKEPVKLVNAILELITKQFHCHRGYVFEHDEESDTWRTTFEWCAKGIPSQIAKTHNIRFHEPGYYEHFFNEQGEFIARDVSQMDVEIYTKVCGCGVHSFVQLAMKQDGIIKCFIGFDNCERNWVPDKDELTILHTIVMMLDVFVFRQRYK